MCRMRPFVATALFVCCIVPVLASTANASTRFPQRADQVALIIPNAPLSFDGLDDAAGPASCSTWGHLNISYGGVSAVKEARLLDFVLIDPKGRRTGYDTSQSRFLDEIPAARFQIIALDEEEAKLAEEPDGALELCNPMDGVYTLQAVGASDGWYWVQMLAASREDFTTAAEPRVRFSAAQVPHKPAKRGTVQTIRFRYSRDPNTPIEILDGTP